MSQRVNDLQEAREAYFSAGGIESDLGPRDNPVWYWRRAFKIVDARRAVVTRERDAYRQAKQENDDRFMTERDEARKRAAKAEVLCVALIDARGRTLAELADFAKWPPARLTKQWRCAAACVARAREALRSLPDETLA